MLGSARLVGIIFGAKKFAYNIILMNVSGSSGLEKTILQGTVNEKGRRGTEKEMGRQN